MSRKRFTLSERDLNEINNTNAIADNGIPCTQRHIVKLLNELHEENVQLKQFQEQVASVIEGKMGDNVCNDYKMEVLKEIWNELELDEVWFE